MRYWLFASEHGTLPTVAFRGFQLSLLSKSYHLILDKWLKDQVEPVILRGVDEMFKNGISVMSILRERVDANYEQVEYNAMLIAHKMIIVNGLGDLIFFRNDFFFLNKLLVSFT